MGALQPGHLIVILAIVLIIFGPGKLADIGKSLGIEVIAEGVETMEHAQILKELGCDILQGFLFGYPMDAKAFKTFAQSRKWLAAS